MAQEARHGASGEAEQPEALGSAAELEHGTAESLAAGSTKVPSAPTAVAIRQAVDNYSKRVMPAWLSEVYTQIYNAKQERRGGSSGSQDVDPASALRDLYRDETQDWAQRYLDSVPAPPGHAERAAWLAEVLQAWRSLRSRLYILEAGFAPLHRETAGGPVEAPDDVVRTAALPAGLANVWGALAPDDQGHVSAAIKQVAVRDVIDAWLRLSYPVRPLKLPLLPLAPAPFDDEDPAQRRLPGLPQGAVQMLSSRIELALYGRASPGPDVSSMRPVWKRVLRFVGPQDLCEMLGLVFVGR